MAAQDGVPAGGHIDDWSAAYALGALEGSDAARVRDHAATCVDCARELGRAEAAVVALDERTIDVASAPPELEARLRASLHAGARSKNRRPAPLAYAALAAALLLVAGGTVEVRAVFDLRRIAAQDDAALPALVNSHFTHQNFVAVAPGAPAAKVLLGRAPRWLYVIVDSPACGCRLYARRGSGERDLGPPLPHGRTSTLYVPELSASELLLRNRNGVVARAALQQR